MESLQPRFTPYKRITLSTQYSKRKQVPAYLLGWRWLRFHPFEKPYRHCLHDAYPPTSTLLICYPGLDRDTLLRQSELLHRKRGSQLRALLGVKRGGWAVGI